MLSQLDSLCHEVEAVSDRCFYRIEHNLIRLGALFAQHPSHGAQHPEGCIGALEDLLGWVRNLQWRKATSDLHVSCYVMGRSYVAALCDARYLSDDDRLRAFVFFECLVRARYLEASAYVCRGLSLRVKVWAWTCIPAVFLACAAVHTPFESFEGLGGVAPFLTYLVLYWSIFAVLGLVGWLVHYWLHVYYAAGVAHVMRAMVSDMSNRDESRALAMLKRHPEAYREWKEEIDYWA